MKWTGLALGLGLVVIGLGTAPAAAQGSRAVDTCAKTALQQAMLLMSVEDQSALRDKRGVVVGTKVDMRVNALGKKKVVSCYYTDATRVAVIRPYQQGSGSADQGNGSGNITALRRDAVRACQKSSQQQGLMLDNVVSQNDVYNRRGQISGSEVIINVFQAGRPAQVVCEFDYESRGTSLELRRATLR
jgi:hypothetical protein